MILERGKPTKDICSLSHGESAGVRGSYERVSPLPGLFGNFSQWERLFGDALI